MSLELNYSIHYDSWVEIKPPLHVGGKRRGKWSEMDIISVESIVFFDAEIDEQWLSRCRLSDVSAHAGINIRLYKYMAS